MRSIGAFLERAVGALSATFYSNNASRASPIRAGRAARYGWCSCLPIRLKLAWGATA